LSKALVAATLVAATALSFGGGVSAQERAPGLAPSSNSAEGGLWTTSERAERDARRSAELNSDPRLNAYVREVTCKVAPEYCPELRVYVMDRPAFNASAAPNGYIEVWSGLLLRAASEAELAFVIGHEVGHYAENHSLERWNTTKGWLTAAMIVTAGVGVAGAYYQVDVSGLGDLVYLTAMSSIFSYGRGQEAQSDEIGFKRTVAAGYAPSAPARIWRSLQAETRASTFPSVRRREAANSVFRTHPLTEARIDALDALNAGLPQDGEEGRDRLRAAIRPHLAGWLDDEIERRDFGGVLLIIDRLETGGEDLGVLEFARGEVYRQRRDDGDVLLAHEAYEKSSAYPDAPPVVWRELGDLEVKLGNPSAARAAYEKYLAAIPSADDRWIVEDSLKSLSETT